MNARQASSPRRAIRTSYRPDSFGRTVRWTVGVVVVPAIVLLAAAYVAYRVEGSRWPGSRWSRGRSR